MHLDVWLLWVTPEAEKQAPAYIIVCCVQVNIRIIAHIFFFYTWFLKNNINLYVPMNVYGNGSQSGRSL